MRHHPERIGPYIVLGPLAEGSMATLYRVRHQDGGPVVCLKRLVPDVVDDEDGTLLSDFMNEIEIARSLHHPNIVEVFDLGQDDGPYYTMELVDGPDLATFRFQHGTLPWELVAYLGAELCRALMYIHRSDPATGRKPLVHSDVTPHNVLLDPSGAVKLADFGVARVLRRTGAETITRARGKYSYMSPEQWLGDPVGARSDLFSLGVVLWCALIPGHPYAEGKPVDGETFMDTWIQQCTVANKRSLAVDRAPNARPELTRAIDRLLQPVDKRLATADELYSILAPLAPYDAHERLAQRMTS